MPITTNLKNLYLTRIIVTTLAGMLFLWTFSVTIHDIIDPQVNLAFMAKVLAGGTPRSSLSINNEYIIYLLLALYGFRGLMLIINSSMTLTPLFHVF